MYVKKAKTDEDYRQFITNYIGLELEEAYMRRNDTYVLKHKGKIIGGFILSYELPLRCYDTIDDPGLRQALGETLKNENIVEIACVWLAKLHRKKWGSKMLWLGIVFHTIFNKAAYIVFSSVIPKIQEVMNYSSWVHLILDHTCRQGEKTITTKIHIARISLLLQGLGFLQCFYFTRTRTNKKPPKLHKLHRFTILKDQAKQAVRAEKIKTVISLQTQ